MEQFKQLEYTPDFKEVIAQNPGALKSFLKLEKEIESSYNPEDTENEKSYTDGEITITPLYRNSIHKNFIRQTEMPITGYLKVEIGDQKFFVKTLPGFYYDPENSSGIEEFKSIEKADEVLKDIEGVKVIEPQLGYHDKEKNKTYFVSKWLDLPSASEYCYKAGFQKSEPIRFRIKNIISILNENGFRDVHTGNMFYDETSDTLYVYDVFDTNLNIKN